MTITIPAWLVWPLGFAVGVPFLVGVVIIVWVGLGLWSSYRCGDQGRWWR